MEYLPKDPAILVSSINMLLRDEEFDTLQETFEFMEFYTMKGDVDKMLNINLNFKKHNKKK